MILTLSICVPIIGLLLWASGIIPGAVREYREFKDEMDGKHNPFEKDKK